MSFSCKTFKPRKIQAVCYMVFKIHFTAPTACVVCLLFVTAIDVV